MGYSMENIRAVREILARRREDAEALARLRTRELYAKNEALRELDRRLSGTGYAVFRAAFGGGDVKANVAALKAENQAMQGERVALLAEMGLAPDYTEPHYTCTVCRDTGYTEKGAMCVCMKRLLVEAGIRSSGLGNLLKRQSFESFSLDYYEGEAKTYAARVLEASREFAEDFDRTGRNLLFMGGTGLGKTHLSTSIAGRVIARGFDVVYETAQNVISDFEYDRFKSGYGESEKRSDKYLSADLLIMDDLGAELTNQFTVASLYNIINTRINLGKSTIISTNLGQKALLERYDERITSRLFGEFDPFLFRGKDIRGLK